MIGTWLDVGCSDVSGSMCVATSPVDSSECSGVGVPIGLVMEELEVESSQGTLSDLVVNVAHKAPRGVGISSWFSFSDSSIAFLKS